LCQHATEEMAILGNILPEMYTRFSGTHKESL
jgi:hypothetical protein